MTQTGVVVGTPYYMSPEQALGEPPVDATTDLWSLGVVAFEAMTGTRPFDGPTMGALTIAICAERPPVPSEVNPEIPPSVDAWLARACARDRAQRFPSAKAMGDALLAAVRGLSFPEAIPLAFQATSSSPGSKESPAVAPPPDHRRTPGLGTTTTPISRSARPNDPGAAPPLPVPVLESPGGSVLRSRGRYLGLGAALVVLGVAVGFAFASRDHERSPVVPPAAVAVPVVAAPAKTPDASAAPPPASDSAPVASEVPAVLYGVSIPAKSSTARAQATTASARPSAPPPPAGSASVTRPQPPADSVTPPPSAAHPATSCDPPYFFDDLHNKVYKQECL